jgi:pimeloyl-ACP methyl ester carboxylesterase
MAYTDEGGDTLLLVHGFPLNRQAWSPQVAAFRRDYRVIAPDRSSWPAIPWAAT